MPSDSFFSQMTFRKIARLKNWAGKNKKKIFYSVENARNQENELRDDLDKNPYFKHEILSLNFTFFWVKVVKNIRKSE